MRVVELVDHLLQELDELAFVSDARQFGRVEPRNVVPPRRLPVEVGVRGGDFAPRGPEILFEAVVGKLGRGGGGERKQAAEQRHPRYRTTHAASVDRL